MLDGHSELVRRKRIARLLMMLPLIAVIDAVLCSPGFAAMRTASCSNQARFDISTTAGFYSTVAGVLAGFAFFGLILLATSGGASTKQKTGAATVLAEALVVLVLVSIMYAILAGEPESSGRAASEEVIAGIGFAVSALLLMFALALTFEEFGHLKDVGARLRDIASFMLCPLGFLVILLGASDYNDVGHRSILFTWLLPLIALVLMVIGVIALIFWWRPGGATTPRPQSPPSSLDAQTRQPNTRSRVRGALHDFRRPEFVGLGGMIATIASVVTLSAFESALNACDRIPFGIMLAVVGAGALLFVLAFIAFRKSRESRS